MKKYLILLASLVLTACNLNAGYHSTPQAWLDAPLDGMILPLAPYEIVAHASDPGGVSQIEFNVNGDALGSLPGSGQLFTARQVWNPPAPGEYVIQARGMNSDGVWSEFAKVKVTIAGQIAAPTATTEAAPNLTPTPSVPTLVLIQNANCRFGPGQVFEVVNSALAGDSLPIAGKNEGETWWLVNLPSGEKCWISAVTGHAFGDPSSVPVDPGPPTPEPLIQGCYVYDPNLQPICTVPCPQNADPGGECTP